MYAIANTTVSVLRGATVDSYGDLDDSTAVAVHTGVIAQIIEASHRVYDSATQTPRVVRTMQCTMPSDADVTSDDQILDERSRIVYDINDATDPGRTGVVPDLQVTLTRVTSTEHK